MFSRPVLLPIALLSVMALAVGWFWMQISTQPPAVPLTPAGWKAPQLPSTPAGQQFDALLAAFNSGQQEELKAFVEQNFSAAGPGGDNLAKRARSQLQLYSTSRGIDVFKVTESSNFAVTVIAQFRLTQEWRELSCFVEPSPPHRITGIKIVPADPPSAELLASRPSSSGSLDQQIDAYISRLVTADQFSGAVLVAKEGEPLFQQAYGMADPSRELANNLNTQFNYASLGKMFTAVAIAQLVEAGKLAYADPVRKHVPEYSADIAAGITLEHLLTHRSGIVDCFVDANGIRSLMASTNPQHDYLDVFIDQPLCFVPGERFEYSNSNYILLGLIVERCSGIPFAEYLRKHVFDVAGMSHTVLALEEVEENNLASGYTGFDDSLQYQPGKRQPTTLFRPRMGSAAGGGYTTVGDLLRFERALRTHKLLPPEATEQLLAERSDYGRPGYSYGYGFVLRQAGQQRVAGHSGGAHGIDAQFDMYLDSGYAIIILANYDQVAEPLVMHIERLLGSR